MNISVISASHRLESQSERVAKILGSQLNILNLKIGVFNLDLAQSKLPLWSPEKKNAEGIWGKYWRDISLKLNESSGFIMVLPEYGGMATPIAKNLFLLCDDGELFHKPGLIVSVSSGNGGAYPIAELRSSSYKNTHIMWIPENIIIRNVEEFSPGAHGENIPEWIDDRINYVLKLFLAYASNMKPLRKIINRKDFGNGM